MIIGCVNIDKIYVDTVGLKIRVDAGRDITGATPTELHVKKPDGTTATWSATIADSNYLEYTTLAGDLDQSGTYRLQSVFTLSGWTGPGETYEFTIYDNYQ